MVTLIRENQIPQAVDILLGGGVIAFRTETVYGLASTIVNSEKIFIAKGRPSEKNLVWQFASVRDCVKHFKDKITDDEIRMLRKYKVGFTLVLSNGIAVRIPHDRIAKRVLRACGVPLVVTSANLSGQPPATTWQEIESSLGDRIDAIIMSSKSKYGQPSTIAKINGKNIEILRQGFAKIRNVCNN